MTPRALPLWAGVLLCLAALVAVLHRPLLLGETIGSFDQIRTMAPWNEAASAGQAWDVLQADGVLQSYPWREMALRGWRTGDLPFWNPHQLMGTPLAANSQSGGFYPPHVLLGLIGTPVGPALTILLLFHLAVAGAGAFFLTRRLGGSQTGSLCAAAAFGASPFLASWSALASVPTTVAWIPWALWAAAGLTQPGAKWPVQTAWLGLFSGLLILAGHLQFAFYGLIGAGLLGLGLAMIHGRWLSLLPLAAGLGLGAALAGVHLLPTLENSKFSHRQAAATAEGYAAYVAGGLSPVEAAGLVFPSLVGAPGRSVTVGNPPSEAPSYWPSYLRRGAAFAEGALAIGPLVLALLALARRRGRELWVVGGLGIVALLLAFGTPLNAALYFGLPGWSATGSPGRALCLFVLAAAVALGLLLPKDDEEAPQKQLWYGLAGAAVLGLILAAVGLNQGSWIPGLDPKPIISAQIAAGLVPALAVLALAGAALYLACRADLRSWTVAPVAAMAALMGAGLLPSSAKPFERAAPDPSVRVAAVNGPWELLAAAPALLPPNTATALGVNDVAGYDSLLNRDTVRILKEINGQDAAPPANGNMMFIKPESDWTKLSAAGVTEVWSRREIPALGTPYQTEPTLRYRLEGPGRADVDGRPVTWEFDGMSRQSLTATGPGLLTIRDRNLPGWTATVNGKPAELGSGDFRQIQLPDGECRIELAYTPPGLGAGIMASSAALLALLVLAISSRFQHFWKGPKAEDSAENM